VIDETGIEAKSFVNTDTVSENPTIEELESQLKILEQNEEYEKAAELLERINKLYETERQQNQQ
jgi:protein-arginine kinase activator protein McsA